MRDLDPKFIPALEEEAIEWIAKLKAFRNYEGNDKRYAEKAKVGMSLISSVSRFYASETNREALRLAASKVGGGPRLTAGGEG